MRAALLLLVLATAGCADEATGPVSEPPAYDLVFEGETGAGTPLLFRAALDDTTARPLGAGYAGHRPLPRPGARTVAFHSVMTDVEPSRLMLLEDGAAPVSFVGGTGGLEREVSWSPDGTHIAFTAFRDDAYGDIFTASVQGSRLAELRNVSPAPTSERFAEMTPAWSPDGTRIAFTSYRGGSPALWIMDADGSHPRQVTETGPHGDYFPNWSPDGRRLAFQRNVAGNTRVGIVAAEGGAPRFLEWSGKMYHPAWSPDGEALAVAAEVEGEIDVFVVTLEGNPLLRIRRPGRDLSPAWMRRTP